MFWTVFNNVKNSLQQDYHFWIAGAIVLIGLIFAFKLGWFKALGRSLVKHRRGLLLFLLLMALLIGLWFGLYYYGSYLSYYLVKLYEQLAVFGEWLVPLITGIVCFLILLVFMILFFKRGGFKKNDRKKETFKMSSYFKKNRT